MLHRTRDLLVRQRTQLINALRAHLGELGLVAAQGCDGVKVLIGIVRDETNQLPDVAQAALQFTLKQLDALQQQIGELAVPVPALGDHGLDLGAVDDGAFSSTTTTRCVNDARELENSREDRRSLLGQPPCRTFRPKIL